MKSTFILVAVNYLGAIESVTKGGLAAGNKVFEYVQGIWVAVVSLVNEDQVLLEVVLHVEHELGVKRENDKVGNDPKNEEQNRDQSAASTLLHVISNAIFSLCNDQSILLLLLLIFSMLSKCWVHLA